MSKYYTKIWYKTDSDFEKLRNDALTDSTNNKAFDFTPDKLVIEDHDGYMAMFSKETNNPVAMCGLYKIKNHPGVGRLMNRSYVWPDFRADNRKDLFQNMYDLSECLIKPFYNSSPYHTHIMSMPNRSERNNFFRAYYAAHNRAWPGHWHLVNGYVQTGSAMDRDSWQNIITDNPDYNFKTLNHDQWLLLREREHS